LESTFACCQFDRGELLALIEMTPEANGFDSTRGGEYRNLAVAIIRR
jgi:hypothetical protein